jgi:hypothetical protein
MNIFTLLWSLVLTAFSSAVLSYVALATPLGPWMGPTLALGTIILGSLVCKSPKDMVFAVCAGSLGGIVATGMSFSFPTLFFLDSVWFSRLTGSPLQFFLVVAGLAFSAGLCGLILARTVRKDLIEDQNLAFPVGQLVYKIIDAQGNKKQSRHLIAGFLTATLYALAQIKYYGFRLIPAQCVVWKKYTYGWFSLPALAFDLTIFPMLLSLGFIAGHMMTIPLFCGALFRTLLLDPIRGIFFSEVTTEGFMFAVCSGMVLVGAISTLLGTSQELFKMVKQLLGASQIRTLNNSWKQYITKDSVVTLCITVGFLTWCKFSFAAQIYLIIATVLCAYQIAAIAGKIGLALLGRFATFVMVPAMLLFKLNALQITLVAAFVEVCAGVATEALFGYKTASMAEVDHKKVYYYQLWGLLVSACAVAVVLYFLVTHFQLGSGQLFAQRAQARALLINAPACDYRLLFLGAVFGYALKYTKLNPMLVLGGLLMPLHLVVALACGGLLSLVVSNKDAYEPFCSGVYAANALAMLLSLFI